MNLVLSVATIVIGTAQARRWRLFSPVERLHWQSTAVLNLAILIGTIEALHGDYPGGLRIYLISVGLWWLLTAVLYRPVLLLVERRRRRGAP